MEARREAIVEEATRSTGGHPLQIIGWLSWQVAALELELQILELELQISRKSEKFKC